MDSALATLIDQAREDVRYHMDGLHGGQLGVDDWQASLARSLATYHVAAYLAGADTETLDDDARRRLADLLGPQIDRLNRFADALEDGGLSDASADARADLYAEAIRASWWAGAMGADLPAYPGDGSTPCLSRCGCAWAARDDGYYWTLGTADSCEECTQRAAQWAPWTGGA